MEENSKEGACIVEKLDTSKLIVLKKPKIKRQQTKTQRKTGFVTSARERVTQNLNVTPKRGKSMKTIKNKVKKKRVMLS